MLGPSKRKGRERCNCLRSVVTIGTEQLPTRNGDEIASERERGKASTQGKAPEGSANTLVR